ncbi:MAG: cytochrome b/b6 domain-containing protein, partial [Paracoccaceae bacterium]
VWDPLIRIFHWSLVGGFTANALFVDGDADLHEVIGYAILALILVRLLWGFIGPRYARFSSFPPNPAAAIGQVAEIARGSKTVHLGHSPLGALMIYNLLLSIVAIIVTGWMMTTTAYWGVKWVEEAHEVMVTWAELSVFVHIAAVMFESLRIQVNLPKAMVTGYKNVRSESPEI